MPKTTTKRYRALRHVSVRLSTIPNNRLWDVFAEFTPGDYMDTAPAHTDWAGLLETGAIEEVQRGEG